MAAGTAHLAVVADEPLAAHLAAHPELLGSAVVERFRDAGAAEGNLPFLFKVLAIEKALSIQTHPDKKTAEVLHRERPDVYKGACAFVGADVWWMLRASSRSKWIAWRFAGRGLRRAILLRCETR